MNDGYFFKGDRQGRPYKDTVQERICDVVFVRATLAVALEVFSDEAIC